jgi:Fe-S-cluster containining protein
VTCHVGCCYEYVVPLCGADVWALARAQKLPPEQFAVAYTIPETRPETFRLEKGGPMHGLALDKRGKFELKQPCVFLLDLPGGFRRCGVYADRPLVCRAYPMASRRGGGITLRDKPLCPEGAWPRSEQLRPYWRTTVQGMEMAYDVYAEVVARWNARVEATPGRATMNEYFSYLMTVYDQLAGLEAELGRAGLERIRESWRTAPTPESTPDEVRARPEEFPWLPYLDRVAAVVAELYPWAPPLGAERIMLQPPEEMAMPLLPDDQLEPAPSGAARWP